SIVVGEGVTISPENPSAAPLGAIAFTATGGSGTGYGWRLVGNASGATINGSSGQYLAGPFANVVDRVEVTDSFGNSAAVNVRVGAALAIAPASAQVPPRGTFGFSASGGSGAYVWSLVAAPSGGRIDASTGAYVAGAIPSVIDRVRVRDA